MLPSEPPERQTVHCIVGNVVEVLHGSWAENVHLCAGGFGMRGSVGWCFLLLGLLRRLGTVGPCFPGFSWLDENTGNDDFD